MSYSFDVNLLLYASDSGSAHQPMARRFLGDCAASRDLLCLAWPTLMGYLWMATHPSIFGSPLSPAEAASNIEALLVLPQVRLISEQEGFWELYKEVTAGRVVRGPLVPDAHLATLLRQHGVRTFYTNDADFLRFGFLEVRNPLV